METLKYLLITLLCAGVLGAAAGISIGKYIVYKAKHGSKPLLKKKERYICLGCAALGAICICFGLFLRLPGARVPAVDGETAMTGENTPGGGRVQSGGVIRRGSRGGGTAFAVRVGKIMIPGMTLAK